MYNAEYQVSSDNPKIFKEKIRKKALKHISTKFYDKKTQNLDF